MSLLPTVNAASVGSSPNYYFALTGDNSTINAAGFVSTENGYSVDNGANYTAKAEVAAGVNADALTIVEGGGLKRWTVGVANAEAGANSGSDLVVKRYDDTGALLGSALTITRSTGNASASGALTIGGNMLMNGTLSGATNVVYSNTDYLSDIVFTAPEPAAPGKNAYQQALFTPTKTGIYLMDMTFGVNANTTPTGGYTAGPNDSIGWAITYAGLPPVPPNVGGQAIALSVIPIPNEEIYDYGRAGSVMVKLVAGIQYKIEALVNNISGTMGGCPLATEFSLAQLC